MAQRFIIDGNFTQSLGNVNLNVNACPTDGNLLPYVFYNINTGNLCYSFDDRICYDYLFDHNHYIVTESDNKEWRQGQALDGRFLMISERRLSPLGINPRWTAHPTRSVDDTLYLLFNTQSNGGVDLYNYLTLYPGSGSITLTSTHNIVNFEYNTYQHNIFAPTSSADRYDGYSDQIILG